MSGHSPGIHIILLNYNGRGLLGETLPTVLEACSWSVHACRVSVIDNESTDGGAEFIASNFPSVGLIRRPNRVLCSYNDVVAALDENIVILLNNDLKVDAGFVDPLIECFEKDPALFLAAPKAMDFDGARLMGGPSRAEFSFGLLKVSDSSRTAFSAADRAGPTFAAGCAGAYDRKKFVELGGYDDLYLPGTMEDTDLCLRAWRMGWRCVYEPKSVVFHMGQASFHARFGEYGTRAINARNNFLFLWKNFSGTRFWIAQAVWAPLRLAAACVRGQWFWPAGFFRALAHLGAVRRRRAEVKKGSWRFTAEEVVSDDVRGGTSAGASPCSNVPPRTTSGISAVVITKDEEQHIAECLEALRFCDEIVVVDSGSRDRTAEIAARLGARVVTRVFDDFASQKNFGISQAAHAWVLSIDADERVGPELRAEILATARGAPEAVAAFKMPRENEFFGRRLRTSGGADAPVRLLRKGRCRFEGVVHERVVVEGGQGRLRNRLRHLSTPSAKDYMRKLNHYTALEAVLLRERGARPGFFALGVKPLGRFFERYAAQRGFLDGREGFFYAALGAYYEFVRQAKLSEISRSPSDTMNGVRPHGV